MGGPQARSAGFSPLQAGKVSEWYECLGASRGFPRPTTVKRILAPLLLLVVPLVSNARLMRAWTYQEMFDKADLVVIARPLATKDTTEKAGLPPFGPHVEVIGLSTEFEARTVMKGDKAVTKFVLHHYRLARPKEVVTNGPHLVAFDPASPRAFLLFLVKESDGRYAPVTGQTDPGLFSAIKLEGTAQ